MLDCLNSHMGEMLEARISTDEAMTGLLAGTRIATNMGWRPVEALTAGDMVLTFDGGMQRLVRVDRAINWISDAPCPDYAAPLAVPAGLLGNCEPMYVLPQQGVVVESDLAEELTGDPFAVIPAAALSGLLGVDPVTPSAPHEVIRLVFETDQVIFAGDGALILCDRARSVVDTAIGATTPQYEMMDDIAANEIAEDFVIAQMAAA